MQKRVEKVPLCALDQARPPPISTYAFNKTLKLINLSRAGTVRLRKKKNKGMTQGTRTLKLKTSKRSVQLKS